MVHTIHPQRDDQGRPVPILAPHTPTPLASWDAPDRIGTVVPGGPMPEVLNGVPLTPWTEPPGLWASLPAQVREPPRPPGMAVAAGTVVVEPDGRVWLVAPTNGYSGYRATFPKGRVEGGLSLQACALKETFEETGLWVELLCHLVDLPRSKGFARYYLARRRSGTPAAMGWESQAVLLVPPGALGELLNKDRDLTIAEALRKRLPAGWATGKVELGR